MNTMTIDTMRRLRKENPALSMRNALSIARELHKPVEFDWRDGGTRGLSVLSTRFERDGFDIAIDVSYEDGGYSRATETSDNTGIRNPNFRYNGEWQDYGNRHKRYIELDSGNTVEELASYYRKAGMAKNVAWEFAREALQEEAETYAAEDYTEYVVSVTASVNGTELGSAGLGGIEVRGLWGEEFEREMEDVLSGNDLIGEAIEEARENLPPAVEKEHEKLARMEALTT